MDSSLHNALVSWVNTFNSAEAITDLTDSRVTSGRLLGIITERIFGAGADTCPQNDEECFEYTASGLAEFYQVSGDELVPVYGISEKSLVDISKTLMLLLSWAVHCQQNEEFIVDIRSLSPEDQHSLMLLINSTMKQFGDGSLAAGNFHVGLIGPEAASGTSQSTGAGAVSKPGDGEQQSTSPRTPVMSPVMSPLSHDSPVPPPGGTPARGLSHPDESMPSPASHATSTISKSKFHARMNPTPTGGRKTGTRSSHRSQQSVHFTPTPTRGQAPGTPSVWSSSKQPGVWKNASPALRRWIASPACSMSGSISSAETSDTILIQQRMSSVTYALREQIGLREDLEMQLCQTQEQLTTSEASVRDIERQCKVLETRLVEMEDLQHADVELKKTQAKLDRAMKRLESANDVKSHAEHLQDQLNSTHAELISMETKMAHSDDLTGRVEFYKAQLHGSELRCRSEHARVEQLQCEVEKLSSLYGESTSNVAAVTAEMSRLQGQVEILQDELERDTGAASDEGCGQMTMAGHTEISRLQQENTELRAMLPNKEEMRLMRSQVEDATEMKKSFENLYVETKRQLLEMADEKSAFERALSEEKEKQRKAQHLLDAERAASSAAQHQLRVSEESLAGVAEEGARVAAALAEACGDLKATKAQASDLQQQLTISRHELQASNDAAGSQREHLLEQLGEVRLQLDTASHVLQETGKKHAALLASTEAHLEQRKHWQQLVQATNEKNSAIAHQLEAAGGELGAERERHHAAFVKLQAKYDEVCVDRQSAQQQVAMVKTQLACAAQEKRDAQEQCDRQRAANAEAEASNARLEQGLAEAVERARKLQASSAEQVAGLQRKVLEQDQSGRDLFSVVGQQAARLLQRLTGNEWSALDADASASAQQQNMVSLLGHIDRQHTDVEDQKTALQAEADDLRCQLTAVGKQAAEELNEMQASLQQKTEAIGLLKAKKKELQQNHEKAELALKVFAEERAAMQLSQRESLEQRAELLKEAAQLRMQMAVQEDRLEKATRAWQVRCKEVDELKEQVQKQEEVAKEHLQLLTRSQRTHCDELADKDGAMEAVAAELAASRAMLIAAKQGRGETEAQLLQAREAVTTLEASVTESSRREAGHLDRVAGLQRDAESAAAELDAARGELAAKEELNEQRSADITALQQRLDSMTEDLSRQQAVAVEQTSSVDDAAQQLAQKEREISRLSANVERLEAAMQRAVEDAGVQSGTVAELQSDLLASQSAHKAIEETVSERDSQFSGLRENIAERDSQIGDLKATLSDRDSRLDALQSQLSERDSQLTSRISERDSQLGSLQSQISERDSRLDSLQSQISERDSQLADVRETASGSDQQVAQLTSAVDSLERRLSARDEEIAANALTMATLQQASDMSAESASAVAGRLAARAAEIDELRATLDAARQRNQQLAGDLSAASSDAAALALAQQQRGASEQERQQLCAAGAALRADGERLQSEVRRLRAHCEQLGAERRVDGASAVQLVTLQDEYAALQRRHGSVAAALQQREQELEQHRRQRADGQQSAKEAKAYAEQASSNYRALQQEMSELVQRYQDSSNASKATCHAVMEEARKRVEEAESQHQELTGELEHTRERVHHYEQMTATLERQLQLATQQMQSLQQQATAAGAPPLSSSSLSSGGGTSFRQMMQPGYEAVHAEFDTGHVSPSRIEKLRSPGGQVDGDISSFLAGTDKKRTSTRPAAATAAAKVSGGGSRRATTATASMPPFAWADDNACGDQESDDNLDDEDRLRELNRRNTLAPSHLKSTYPVELQTTDGNKASAPRRRTASTSSSQRATSKLSAMPAVVEERPASKPAPAPVQSYSMVVSPPRSNRKRAAAPAQIVAQKRASVTQDDDGDDSAKRRQTFLIASPKTKENVDSARSRTAAQPTSALARSGRGEVSTAETEAAGDDLGGMSTEVPKSKIPPHLAARMASYQQKADSKAAAAAAAAAAASSKKKKSRPLSHRNKA